MRALHFLQDDCTVVGAVIDLLYNKRPPSSEEVATLLLFDCVVSCMNISDRRVALDKYAIQLNKIMNNAFIYMFLMDLTFQTRNREICHCLIDGELTSLFICPPTNTHIYMRGMMS